MRAGYINQAYSGVTLRPLFLSCCLMNARSVASYLFLCMADPSLGYLADLWFEGRHSCQLLIGEGHKAFSDLAV